MGARFERARLTAGREQLRLSGALQPSSSDWHVNHAASASTGHLPWMGCGASGTAAAAQPPLGAWRQTYMVPRIC